MKNKILLPLSIIFILVLPFIFYLNILPNIISSPKVIDFAQKQLDKTMGIKSVINNPVLKTGFSSVITLKVDALEMTSQKGKIIALDNFIITVSLKDIFSKKIILDELGADFIYLDLNRISDLTFKTNDKKAANDWNVDVYNSLIYLKKSLVMYRPNDDTELKFTADDLKVDNSQKQKRFIHFNLSADITKKDKFINFNIKDNNTVYFKDNHFWVKKCFLEMNKSKIFFDAVADRKKNYEIKIYSDKILADDVLTFIDSQIIENNLQEPLSYFKDIQGSFNFWLKITKDTLSGIVNLNNINCKIVPIANIPLNMRQGRILLTKDKITLKDFKGFYNNKSENSISMEGTVNDYLKSIDTKLTVRANVTNDFMKNYLSKMVNTPLELTGGSTKTKLELKAINNKIDMSWLFGLKKGQDILIDGMSVGSDNFAKGVNADMHYENNLLTIRSLDYYMIPEEILKKLSKDQLKPLLKFSGDVSISATTELKRLGFNIPRPLPSEILNLFIGQKIFKGGKISGNMNYVLSGNYPVLQGQLNMEGVAMPSQRLFIKDAQMKAQDDIIEISSKGGYRRSRYDIKGKLFNELKFPVVAKDLDLKVDNIDVEKFLVSANNQSSEAIKSEKFDWAPSGEAKDDDDDNPTFDIGNFVVEKGTLEVVKGNYKEIEFSNVKADFSLDRDSVFDISSNRFDIANGYSSAKINCNLKKHLYSLLLGVKDVDADLIAANLINLPREISGKSSGFIKLNTDDTLNLNGSMVFNIKDGIIQKVGLVEYLLTVATIFRNPLTMVSPAVLSDLINVPEGKFDKISGKLELKDNVIERMMIKSSSPQLSSFIVGRYDLNTSDATLRVYTKFSNRNKGFFGFLRNISLNGLANSIPLSRRNYSNYYAAEIEQLPDIDAPEKDTQIFVTKIDGDIEHNNFISSLKKIK